jgi:hypothetical protein
MRPLVFLSHSSRDKNTISRLKQLLFDTTDRTVDFFVSSDDQSIEPGRNWYEEVLVALNRAEVAFAFLSPNALQSQWVLFEVGVALGRGKQVIPIGMSGVDVHKLSAPLGLLQGYNLNSGRGLTEIVNALNRLLVREYRLQSPDRAFRALLGAPISPLENGKHRFRVYTRAADREIAHELLEIDVYSPRMTVRSESDKWESVGFLVENRFIGSFKFTRGSSANDVRVHDFQWDGREFVGSAWMESGRWFNGNLVWRPLSRSEEGSSSQGARGNVERPDPAADGERRAR